MPLVSLKNCEIVALALMLLFVPLCSCPIDSQMLNNTTRSAFIELKLETELLQLYIVSFQPYDSVAKVYSFSRLIISQA